jgi:D-glycero-alpha-D-manno-heptose-7-phosphate kinase
MKILNYSKLLLNKNSTVKKALIKIKSNGYGILFIMDYNNTVIGSVSDGDIRTQIIKSNNLDLPISICVNKNFHFINSGEDREKILKLYDKNIRIVPVLDRSKKIIQIIDLKKINISLSKKDKIIKTRSPLRISLAGGGTDFAEYFYDNSGLSISLAIEKYVYAVLKIRDDSEIVIESNQQRQKIIYKNIKDIKYDGKLDIIKAPIKLLKPDFGFEIYVETSLESKSGLGGSSAITAAVLGAINYFQSYKLNRYEISEHSIQAERVELNIPGGWQDQYSSVFGGCNIIEFNKKNNLVYNVNLNKNILSELEQRIFICNTGLSHKGSFIQKNNKISNKLFYNFVSKNKLIAEKIKTLILKGDLDKLGEVIQEGWELKKKVSKYMLNNKINSLEKKLLNSGASGCRLLGSGGGGYMLFYVNTNQRPNFLRSLKSFKIDYFSPKFDNDGLYVWNF